MERMRNRRMGNSPRRRGAVGGARATVPTRTARPGSGQAETPALQPMFDPAQPPTRAVLTARLGAAAGAWRSAISRATRREPSLEEAWHFAGAKIGWSLRLVDGER